MYFKTKFRENDFTIIFSYHRKHLRHERKQIIPHLQIQISHNMEQDVFRMSRQHPYVYSEEKLQTSVVTIFPLTHDSETVGQLPLNIPRVIKTIGLKQS